MSELRITGGRLRGRRLRVPQGVRPTEGRVREALFSIWQQRVPGARLVELFAGAGSVGLEAISRGAREVVFVEGDARVARALEQNLKGLAPPGSWRRHRLRLPSGLAVLARAESQPFDLAFADPPYAFRDHDRLVMATAPLLAPDGELVIEHAADLAWRPSPDLPLRMADRRVYGGSALSFLRR
ncbi:MAG TPA: 16S rRNA (guanine(966)-N(2))-methyltransferase RsmD [Thermoanaerobaculia bacterium]|nr:16S rRNA (guanine(966)-N(2))-methyltransferase RsmD [Thermoanaerobaculia bacterium]